MYLQEFAETYLLLEDKAMKILSAIGKDPLTFVYFEITEEIDDDGFRLYFNIVTEEEVTVIKLEDVEKSIDQFRDYAINKSSTVLSEKRIKEIKDEAQRRLSLWLSNSTFDDMTVSGSYIRFNIALGLLDGYLFEKEDWMNENDFQGFVTNEEYDSIDYDIIITDLFNKAQLENTNLS